MKIINNKTLNQEEPELDWSLTQHMEMFKEFDSINEIFDMVLCAHMNSIKDQYTDFSAEELKKMVNLHCKNIKISLDLFNYLMKEGKFEELLNIAPNANITIIPDQEIDLKQNVENLLTADKLLKDNNRSLYVAAHDWSSIKTIFYEVKDILIAKKQLDDWAYQINSATVEGEPLSPMEKFVYAYMIVKNREYKESEQNRHLSRNPISVLNTDYCVCVGFSSLLKELCSRIGIECAQKSLVVGGWHSINAVIINDKKYGIENALYYSDPTYDCATKQNTHFSCLLPSLEAVYNLYFDADPAKCKEMDQGDKDLFPDEKSFAQAQNNAQKTSSQNMKHALREVFKSMGKSSREVAEYLMPSINLVKSNPQHYKDSWLYEFLKSVNQINEKDNTM